MSERIIEIFINSFPKLLELGIKVTIPIAIMSFLLAFVISVIVAFIQYARVPVLSAISRFYIWITRGTPLLVQLYIFFYGFPVPHDTAYFSDSLLYAGERSGEKEILRVRPGFSLV